MVLSNEQSGGIADKSKRQEELLEYSRQLEAHITRDMMRDDRCPRSGAFELIFLMYNRTASGPFGYGIERSAGWEGREVGKQQR